MLMIYVSSKFHILSVTLNLKLKNIFYRCPVDIHSFILFSSINALQGLRDLSDIKLVIIHYILH